MVQIDEKAPPPLEGKYDRKTKSKASEKHVFANS